MSLKDHPVASLIDFGDKRAIEVEADGRPILLVRMNGAIQAIGARCPHAGGKLVEGVISGERIICPWHKAAFCLRTGTVLEPPALDALPHYEVRLDGERILVSDKGEEEPRSLPRLSDQRRFVILGAGAAGALAAQTLRERGFGGEIVMLDRINRVPYDRTLLSKYVLSGQTGGEKSPLQTQTYYKHYAIERRTADVVELDAQARRIRCSDGEVLSYDAALIASGSAPIVPPLPGIDLPNVYSLRDRTDAERILATAERSSHVVVLGASFIGMEVAASLRERGLDVTLVGRERVPFAQQFGTEIGQAFVALHESRGVRFRLGEEVMGLKALRGAVEVGLSSGSSIKADFVVIGFGVKPATGYLGHGSLESDGSVAVDAYLRAADGLYVAGDAARFPLYGAGPPVRVEHWRVAEQQGRIAARNMLGDLARYDAPPVFWTIQYLKRIDYIGHAEDWDEIVIHGDSNGLDCLAYYVKNGIVAAAAGIGRDADTAALSELFRLRQDWSAADLGERPSSLLAGVSAP